LAGRCCKGSRFDGRRTGPSSIRRVQAEAYLPLCDLSIPPSRHLLIEEQDYPLTTLVAALLTEKRADDASRGCPYRPFCTSTWHGAALAESAARAPPKARQHGRCPQGSGEPGPVSIGPTAPMLRLLPYPYRMTGCRRQPKRPSSPTQAVLRNIRRSSIIGRIMSIV
jgi:hypothetical protein